MDYPDQDVLKKAYKDARYNLATVALDYNLTVGEVENLIYLGYVHEHNQRWGEEYRKQRGMTI